MSGAMIPLTEWIWDYGETRARKVNSSVTEFLQRPAPVLGRFHILALPRDKFMPTLEPVCNEFLERNFVPYEFLLERDQSVNHGFGAFSDAGNQRKVTWMRLVSKSVQVNRDEKGRPVSVATPVTSNAKEWDRSWFNFAFVLIEEKDMNNGNDRTTLLCFDAPPTLLKEFNDLKLAEAQQNDAYFILTIILQELFTVMDNVAWTLADVFRGVEKKGRHTTSASENRSISQSFTTSQNTKSTYPKPFKLLNT